MVYKDCTDYGARYYDSSVGRFTGVDPLAEKYYSTSPYAYVLNNPLRLTDPTGMSAEGDDWIPDMFTTQRSNVH